MSKIGLIFPGQGSQTVGMGKALTESSGRAKAIVEKANDSLGINLSGMMFEGPEEDLKQTEIAQPAIFTASVAALEALREKLEFDTSQVVCAGHSLGEYSALYSAGVYDFETAVRLVRKRGQFMQEAAKESSGSMAAVIGKTETEVEDLCKKADPAGQVQIANLNSPGQIVISGSNSALEAFLKIAQDMKVRVIPLSVSGAFHSKFMQPAAERLEGELNSITLNDALFPVISNVTADIMTEAPVIRGNLLSQVTGSVRWEQSMQKMVSLGVNQMIEIGPGKVLRGLMKKIDSKIKVWNASQPEEIDAIVAEMKSTQVV